MFLPVVVTLTILVTTSTTSFLDSEYPEWTQQFSRARDFKLDSEADIGDNLSGMLGVLADIQEKGDEMVRSIQQQREVLDSLEAAASEADLRIGQAESRAAKLEERKAELELEIAELRKEREGLTENIDQDKLALNKFRTGLNPLVAQLADKRSELKRFDTQIQERRSELQRYEHQLAEISDKEVTISPSPETSPVLLGLLLLSVLLNMAAAPQLSNYLSNLLSNRDREDSLAPEQLLLPPLLDLERSDSAETSFGSRIRRKKGNKARLSKRINRNQQQLSRVTDNDY